MHAQPQAADWCGGQHGLDAIWRCQAVMRCRGVLAASACRPPVVTEQNLQQIFKWCSQRSYHNKLPNVELWFALLARPLHVCEGFSKEMG